MAMPGGPVPQPPSFFKSEISCRELTLPPGICGGRCCAPTLDDVPEKERSDAWP
jgi:hypothetical protein